VRKTVEYGDGNETCPDEKEVKKQSQKETSLRLSGKKH